MKINTLLFNLVLIVKSTFAQENGLSNIIETKTVFNPSSGECKVVNRMLGKDDSYDCCNLLNVVECENRHITKIHIEDRNIYGEIPDEIGNLIYLRELWLDHNLFYGNIPASISNIVYLKDLSLGHNQLTGPIPAELSKLTDLEKLNLYENILRGQIPHELGDLPNLRHLDLSSNFLYGEIPFQLGKLSKLKVLNLDNNELDIASIPQQVQNLPNLTEFHYTNQKIHKEEIHYDNSIHFSTEDIISSALLVFAVVVSFSFCIYCCRNCRIREENDNIKQWKVLNNNESNDHKLQKNNSIVIENNHIAVTVDPPKTIVQPQQKQLDENTLQLKQKIEQQEQQLQQQMQQQQLQLQQIQQMKKQLQQYEQTSS